MYLLSFVFDHSSSAIAYSSLINTLVAIGTFLIVLILRRVEQEESVKNVEIDTEFKIGDFLNDLFCIFPQFNFAYGLFEIYYNSNVKSKCTTDNETISFCQMSNITYQE